MGNHIRIIPYQAVQVYTHTHTAIFATALTWLHQFLVEMGIRRRHEGNEQNIDENALFCL